MASFDGCDACVLLIPFALEFAALVGVGSSVAFCCCSDDELAKKPVMARNY